MNHADFATRCHAIELMVDSLGDAAYELAATSDWNETHAALVQTTDGLHVLDAIVKRTGAAHSDPTEEPNQSENLEGDAAAPVITVHATRGGGPVHAPGQSPADATEAQQPDSAAPRALGGTS